MEETVALTHAGGGTLVFWSLLVNTLQTAAVAERLDNCERSVQQRNDCGVELNAPRLQPCCSSIFPLIIQSPCVCFSACELVGEH